MVKQVIRKLLENAFQLMFWAIWPDTVNYLKVRMITKSHVLPLTEVFHTFAHTESEQEFISNSYKCC